jgi:hypothetical protein
VVISITKKKKSVKMFGFFSKLTESNVHKSSNQEVYDSVVLIHDCINNSVRILGNISTVMETLLVYAGVC